MNDIFLNHTIENYKIVKKIGEGAIGKVYKAYREEFDDYRAIKFIKKIKLKPHWENEIKKVTGLKTTPNVVRYISHNNTVISNEEYIYIFWDYIPSKSLIKVIERNELTIPIIENILTVILIILHACQEIKISHSDLHSGNILIQDSDRLDFYPENRKIWVTDFGYATTSMDVTALDDFQGLNRILQECIRSIDFHKLDIEEKKIHSIIKNKFQRYLLETNSTQGEYVRNPKLLFEKYNELKNRQSDIDLKHIKNISDYLAAELIGDRFEEWKSLFVPKFLAVDTLLNKNICVATGLRGCGKTMIFKRLTEIYNLHLGYSGVKGSDSFIGFYLNARVIAEAFPWLPDEKENEARNQIIHFFHLSWCLEILEWLKLEAKNRNINFTWVLTFFNEYFQSYFNTADSSSNSIFHLISLINRELEIARLHEKYQSDWIMTDYSFLEKLIKTIIKNCTWINDKPFYFFLDDYSTPLVNIPTQRILNPIIFKRSAYFIFKIATESCESFYPYSLNDKPLEEGDDYTLLDFGTEAFKREDNELKEILSEVLQPRIERHPLLSGRNLSIEKLLGKTDNTNIDLAIQIREEKKKIYYHGEKFFYNLWSSDIREMIEIFADMVTRVDDDTLKNREINIINKEIQNSVLNDKGGKFISLLYSATNPDEKICKNNDNLLKEIKIDLFENDIINKISMPNDKNLISNSYTKDNDKQLYILNKSVNDTYKDQILKILKNIGYIYSYGERLVKIIQGFKDMALFDLKNKTSKNEKHKPPKQARRIEIKNISPDNDKDIYQLYKGLIRYGIFIIDHRGKSVIGKIVPRLYLRGLLIPHFNLTFSKRDCITFTWDQFCSFLSDPEKYYEAYKKKHTDKIEAEGPLLTGFNDE